MTGCVISATLNPVSYAFPHLADKMQTRESLLGRFRFSAGRQPGCRRLGFSRALTGC